MRYLLLLFPLAFAAVSPRCAPKTGESDSIAPTPGANRTPFECPADVAGTWIEAHSLHARITNHGSERFDVEFGGGPISVPFTNLNASCTPSAFSLTGAAYDRPIIFNVVSKDEIVINGSPPISTGNADHLHKVAERPFFPVGTRFHRKK